MTPFALFIDIDGTLTGERGVIPQRNIDALKKARELGHKVIINTGRALGNMPRCIYEQIEIDGLVAGNGSVIILDGQELYSNYIPENVIESLAKYAFNEQDEWTVFEGKNHSYNILGKGRETPPEEISVKSYEHFQKTRGSDKIQVVAAGINFDEDVIKSYSDTLTYFKIGHYYDITAKGNNKANGMLKLLELMGIPVKNSIAFGDSENDRSMLENAGMSVVMANSMQSILGIADYISVSNKEGGVGYAIEKFLLKGETI